MPRKIGRNEPCPCGSGKTYKKCCVVEDEKNTRGLRAEHPAGGGGVARALSWLSARYCVESMEALERLAQPPSALVDAATGDPILLTNIHYRVRDWAPIEAALEADARIEPTGESNWTCFESTSADEPRRIVWTVSRRRNKKEERIEVYAQTAERAAEAACWFADHAEDALELITREFIDPAHLWKDRPSREHSPEPFPSPLDDMSPDEATESSQ